MRIFFIGILLIATVSPCMADWSWKLSGVADARLIVPDDVDTWLNNGLGKTRYSSIENDAILRLSQASLLVSVAASDEFSARIHLNLDAEPSRIQTGSRIDLIEAFASYRNVVSASTRFRLLGGFFFPPVSLENRDTAWTSPFTITQSAINSWIGEEVRVTGAESGVILSHNSTEYSFSAAVFGNNDPAGTLLAWRGWALHDRQTGLTDRLPLAPIRPLQPGGLFPKQPDFVEPFREVDGRAGFYGFAGVRNRKFEFNSTYYNNRGESTKFDGVQYAWKTEFLNVGLDLSLKDHFELLSQFLSGSSRMGIGDMVHIDFNSFYFLSTAEFDPFRFTIRYDHFRVKDLDAFQIQDDNREKGDAWTAAWLVKIRQKYRIAVELLRVHSEREVIRNEWQFQTSFRLNL